jgi:uncharacterized membrane protein YagU involved in acid resistance
MTKTKKSKEELTISPFSVYMYIHKRDQRERERERKPQIFEESLVRRWRRGCAAHCTCLSQCSADCVGWARVSDHIPLSVSPAFTFDFVIFFSVYMCVCILSCCHIELCMYTVYMPIADVYTKKRSGRELTRSLAIRGHIVWCLHTTADRPYTFNR